MSKLTAENTPGLAWKEIDKECTTTMKCTKKAIIRDEGYPVGKPAPCHIDCFCGTRVPANDEVNICSQCGVSFDKRGWVL